MYKVVDGGWCQKEKRYKELIEVKLIVDINKNKSFQKSQMQKKKTLSYRNNKIL